jgi:hypothetical protein
VDTSSTGVGTNLADSFYEKIPVSRNVAGLFYLSAGVASGGTVGASNPSISGGSGLENLYVADGVNITDSSFGGIGTFSRVYSSLGTGINLSFVKEVQVKTGGYEPQYGKATGGIVQIVTKSGGSEYHGAVAGYFAPSKMEATRLHPDDFGRFNLLGKTLSQGNFDFSGEIGGYVPGMKENLFFFGSYNPSWQRETVISPPNSGLFASGERTLKALSQNYAAKLTWRANDNHQVEGSVFGDPASTESGTFRTLNIDNDTANSKLEYGSRSVAARWNGMFTSTWLVNASFTWNHNEFTETPEADLHNILDQTQIAGLAGQRGQFTAVGLGFIENTIGDTYGFNVDTTKQFNLFGSHSFNIGYRFEKPKFDGIRTRSGPSQAFPAANADGVATTSMGADPDLIGVPMSPQFQLRPDTAGTCTLCPLMNIPGLGQVGVFMIASRFDVPTLFETEGTNHSIYFMDSWSPSKYFTMNLGMRWEKQELVGGSIAYTFPGFWSPRMGVIFDPWGDRKTKVYGNYGRYAYQIPLDLALRSLTNEVSILSSRWAPEFTINGAGQRIATINSFGTVTPVIDSAHLLNRATGGTGGGLFSLRQTTTGIQANTKMQYLDEFVAGIERELPGGFIVSARYIDRRIKRIVEDGAGVPPEANLSQIYVIANLANTTDLFTNPQGITFNAGSVSGNGVTTPIVGLPAGCYDANSNPTPFYTDPVEDSLGTSLGGICYPGLNGTVWTDAAAGSGLLGDPVSGILFGGEDVPDGNPDGFPKPTREYWAVEFEVNKSFSKNWLLRANWRIAKLFGNFEGAYRNDNGQTDPSISSLFDFVGGDFGLLGAQFSPGVLNTDRRHVVNGFANYTFDRGPKGLGLGVGVRFEQGTPINRFKAHPAYHNAGEIPQGGRGILGRTPVTGSVDLRADYLWAMTERYGVRFGIDVYNIANARRQYRIDQNEDLSFLAPNVDFQRPTGRGSVITNTSPAGFQRPFYTRFMVRLEF